MMEEKGRGEGDDDVEETIRESLKEDPMAKATAAWQGSLTS